MSSGFSSRVHDGKIKIPKKFVLNHWKKLTANFTKEVQFLFPKNFSCHLKWDEIGSEDGSKDGTDTYVFLGESFQFQFQNNDLLTFRYDYLQTPSFILVVSIFDSEDMQMVDVTKNRTYNRHLLQCPHEFQEHIQEIIDVRDDGKYDNDCGYQCVASLIGRGVDEQSSIRKDIADELTSYESTYRKVYSLDFDELLRVVLSPSAGMNIHMGFIISTAYRRPVIMLSTDGSTTFVPQSHIPLEAYSQKSSPICIALVDKLHFVMVSLEENCPLPPFSKLESSELWKARYCDRVINVPENEDEQTSNNEDGRFAIGNEDEEAEGVGNDPQGRGEEVGGNYPQGQGEGVGNDPQGQGEEVGGNVPQGQGEGVGNDPQGRGEEVGGNYQGQGEEVGDAPQGHGEEVGGNVPQGQGEGVGNEPQGQGPQGQGEEVGGNVIPPPPRLPTRVQPIRDKKPPNKLLDYEIYSCGSSTTKRRKRRGIRELQVVDTQEEAEVAAELEQEMREVPNNDNVRAEGTTVESPANLDDDDAQAVEEVDTELGQEVREVPNNDNVGVESPANLDDDAQAVEEMATEVEQQEVRVHESEVPATTVEPTPNNDANLDDERSSESINKDGVTRSASIKNKRQLKEKKVNKKEVIAGLREDYAIGEDSDSATSLDIQAVTTNKSEKNKAKKTISILKTMM